MFTLKKKRQGGRKEGERLNSQCTMPGVSGGKCGLITKAVLFDIFSM